MNSYLERFGVFPELISEAPSSDLDLIVVLPAFNEPELITALKSLDHCTPPDCSVEVIVVLNHSEDSPDHIKKQTEQAYNQTLSWLKTKPYSPIRYYIIKLELPEKHAGVGLARKAGMDEAVRRFARAGKDQEGIILWYDADCTCSENYLSEVYRFYDKNKAAPGAVTYFEHRFPEEESQKEAIIRYELFLRYYVEALRYAGHPYAYHTIGSCISVRNKVYQKQGGMNRRKAGEDFYFLQKLFPLGDFGEINTSTVFPSSRTSQRVPFGTGKAVTDQLQGKELEFYNLKIFAELKYFLEQLPGFSSKEGISIIEDQPGALKDFLAEQKFEEVHSEILSNTSSSGAYIKRFYRWFNGFRVLKYVHFASAEYSPRQKAKKAVEQLLEALSYETGLSLSDYLQQLRERQKYNSAL